MDWPKAHCPKKPPEKVYIRFGRWSARSRNYLTGKLELGVSVCPAELKDGVVTLVVYGNEPWWKQLYGAGRLAFPVTGKQVGTGSDGEPVLRGVRCLPFAIDHNSLPWELRESYLKG